MALKTLKDWISHRHWKLSGWRTNYSGYTVNVDGEPYIRRQIAEDLFDELQKMIVRWKHEREQHFIWQARARAEEYENGRIRRVIEESTPMVPLTEEEIYKVCGIMPGADYLKPVALGFARAIEEAHGIK